MSLAGVQKVKFTAIVADVLVSVFVSDQKQKQKKHEINSSYIFHKHILCLHVLVLTANILKNKFSFVVYRA